MSCCSAGRGEGVGRGRRGVEGIEGGHCIKSPITSRSHHSSQQLHVLMRDEKEGRKKQARSNKQQGKATQHTQGSTFPKWDYM